MSLIWAAALAEVDATAAVHATIRVCARSKWPPSVADIVAELEGGADGAVVWDQVAGLVSRVGTSAAIRELAESDRRAGAALLQVARTVREQPVERARAAFLRAYETPDLARFDEFVDRGERPELPEFVDMLPPPVCLADARRAIEEARRVSTLDASWARSARK